MLEFKRISVTRKGRPVLNDVSFTVPEKSITVLLGKNGCGKSTLLECVTGQVRYSGAITLNGTDISSFNRRALAKEIAVLPQTLNATSLSVESLVSLGRYAHTGSTGILTVQDKSKIASAMSITGIADYRTRACNELSGGERQKAYLAMILAQDTPYILLDEPTTFLDTSYRRETYDLMRSLVSDHGKTLFIVMHDLSEAVALADNICVLDDGRSEFDGSVAEFLSGDIYERLFGVKKYIAFDKVFFA